MRWVFLSLVCLNLLVMVWFWRDQAGANVSTMKSPEQMGESLVLLSELDASDINYKEVKPSTGSDTGTRCYSVGPLADRIDAKHLKVRAEALGFRSELRGLTTGTSIEHWVHIPPQIDRQQSLRLLRELQGRGIDSYIITQGDLAEGISLGLFRNSESASNLTKKMQSLDYDVVIREVSRGEKELWLEFPQVTQLTEAMRKRVVGEGEKLEWMLTDCSHTK
jgi:hypothetical protein